MKLQHHAGGSHTPNPGLQNPTHNITPASDNIMALTHIVQVLTTALWKDYILWYFYDLFWWQGRGEKKKMGGHKFLVIDPFWSAFSVQTWDTIH